MNGLRCFAGQARRSRASRRDLCVAASARRGTGSGSPDANNEGSIAHGFLGLRFAAVRGRKTKRRGAEGAGIWEIGSVVARRENAGKMPALPVVVVVIATRMQLSSFGALRAPKDDNALFGRITAMAFEAVDAGLQRF